MADRRRLGVVLFPGFEVLDVFGPLEVFGGLPDHFDVVTTAEAAGPVASAQRTSAVAESRLADCPPCPLLLVPVMEYDWHRDADVDPFARRYGLG